MHRGYGGEKWNIRPRKMACHNLLRENPMPVEIISLLGLGLDLCIKPTSTNNTTDETFNRIKKTVWRLYALRDAEKDDNLDRKLYHKSDYKFKPASWAIEGD